MRFLLATAALAAAWTASAQGTFEAIVSHANPTPVFEPVDRATVGWTFQPTNFIEVTDLGCFDYLFAPLPPETVIQVGLWTSGGSLLASSFIATSSALTNESRYVSITPVTLDPSQTYHVGAYFPGGLLSVEACGGGVGGSVFMGTSLLLRGAARNNDHDGFGFPPGIPNTGGGAYLAPNFRYRDGIPEPSSWLLLGLGGLFLAARRK